MSETWVKRGTLWTVVVLLFGLAQTRFNYERGSHLEWDQPTLVA